MLEAVQPFIKDYGNTYTETMWIFNQPVLMTSETLSQGQSPIVDLKKADSRLGFRSAGTNDEL